MATSEDIKMAVDNTARRRIIAEYFNTEPARLRLPHCADGRITRIAMLSILDHPDASPAELAELLGEPEALIRRVREVHNARPSNQNGCFTVQRS